MDSSGPTRSSRDRVSGRKKEGGGWKPPSFNTELPTNLTVLEGETATLTCEVTRLRGRAVSWIRQRDLHVISADNLIFTTDNRFQIKVDNNTAVWRLVVTPVLRNDSGAYECQVNTRPKLSWTVNLNVKKRNTVLTTVPASLCAVPVALLEGPRELYIKSGSTLVLTCTATLHPDASSSVNWKHNGSEISITSPRGGVSIETEKEGRQLMSRLSVVHALASDAGNYTCEPDLVTPANLSVYVVEDEVPAAMAHDSGSSSQPSILLILGSCLLIPSAAAAAMTYGSKSVSNGHRQLNRLSGKECQVFKMTEELVPPSELKKFPRFVSKTFRALLHDIFSTVSRVESMQKIAP
ncbi:Immunoglobulin I-set [Trinorchestia longiramus]|nr:Immunoglobulin I-set [Trinorchestia longiramus]